MLEKKNSENRKKVYGSVFKGILFIGLITALAIFVSQMMSD